MSVGLRVAALRQRLEIMFPGQWLSGKTRTRSLSTGITAIDRLLAGGLARLRITLWSGPASSGKLSLLRLAVTNWCTAGLSIIYIDPESRQQAASWAFVNHKESCGRLWFVRPAPICRQRLAASGWQSDSKRQEIFYITDLCIRSNSFDVVILDAGSIQYIPARIYARLTRSLSRAQAALLVVQHGPDSDRSGGWRCHTRVNFTWGGIARMEEQQGLLPLITPAIRCSVWRDALAGTAEVSLTPYVPNRLFTHPGVPDRRARKA